jgi:hypothetical protein
MLKSITLVPNSTEIEQSMRKFRGEINLHPQVKYGFSYAEFHDTQNHKYLSVEIFSIEMYSNWNRNVEIRATFNIHLCKVWHNLQ